jgi:hypothetical protein
LNLYKIFFSATYVIYNIKLYFKKMKLNFFAFELFQFVKIENPKFTFDNIDEDELLSDSESEIE